MTVRHRTKQRRHPAGIAEILVRARAGEDSHDLRMAAHRRRHQRRGPLAGAYVRFRTALEKQPDHVRLATRGRKNQHGRVVAITRVQVCALREQHPHGLHIAGQRGGEQRRDTVAVACVGVGSTPEQYPHDFCIALRGRMNQVEIALCRHPENYPRAMIPQMSERMTRRAFVAAAAAVPRHTVPSLSSIFISTPTTPGGPMTS